MPASMWRAMFSSMTIASSTTKPTDSASASSVMLLMEKPNAYIAAKVPISDTGTASEGMMVADALRKNRKITMTTRITEIIRWNCTSATESRIDKERSRMNCISTAAGIWARNAGNRSRTASTTATVLASGWR